MVVTGAGREDIKAVLPLVFLPTQVSDQQDFEETKRYVRVSKCSRPWTNPSGTDSIESPQRRGSQPNLDHQGQ